MQIIAARGKSTPYELNLTGHKKALISQNFGFYLVMSKKKIIIYCIKLIFLDGKVFLCSLLRRKS
jgi:hypothetical protein